MKNKKYIYLMIALAVLLATIVFFNIRLSADRKNQEIQHDSTVEIEEIPDSTIIQNMYSI